jgi:hypothetical protein
MLKVKRAFIFAHSGRSLCTSGQKSQRSSTLSFRITGGPILSVSFSDFSRTQDYEIRFVQFFQGSLRRGRNAFKRNRPPAACLCLGLPAPHLLGRNHLIFTHVYQVTRDQMVLLIFFVGLLLLLFFQHRLLFHISLCLQANVIIAIAVYERRSFGLERWNSVNHRPGNTSTSDTSARDTKLACWSRNC